MTERSIQLAILATIRSSIVVAAPNYTPRGWWECDVWAVTKAGYAVEYEIKLTRSDFLADAKKAHEQWRPGPDPRGRWERESHRKHDVITSNEHAPSRFFYVVPEKLNGLESLCPPHAGFAIASEDRWGILILRDAPKLHTRKVGVRAIRLAQSRMWHRYWESLRDIERMKHDLADARKLRATA